MKFTHPDHNSKWPHCITIHFESQCFSVVNGEAFGDTERRAMILKAFGFKEKREHVSRSGERNDSGAVGDSPDLQRDEER